MDVIHIMGLFFFVLLFDFDKIKSFVMSKSFLSWQHWKCEENKFTIFIPPLKGGGMFNLKKCKFIFVAFHCFSLQ